jgi:hypothetical protein
VDAVLADLFAALVEDYGAESKAEGDHASKAVSGVPGEGALEHRQKKGSFAFTNKTPITVLR